MAPFIADFGARGHAHATRDSFGRLGWTKPPLAERGHLEGTEGKTAAYVCGPAYEDIVCRFVRVLGDERTVCTICPMLRHLQEGAWGGPDHSKVGQSL